MSSPQSSILVSIYTLGAIAFDRYGAVMFPMAHNTSRQKKAGTVMIIWVLCFLYSVPLAIFKTYEVFPNGHTTVAICYDDWPGNWYVVYEWISFAVSYVLPLLAISILYARMGKMLRGHRSPGQQDDTRCLRQRRAIRKAVNSLIAIVLLFVVCWLPVKVYGLLIPIYERDRYLENQQFKMAFKCTLYIWILISDCIFNPIVYVLLSDKFQADVKKLCCRCVGTHNLEQPYIQVARSSASTTAANTTAVELEKYTVKVE
ncbi:substance-P receptor-like [Saccoglossus kowalevskii]|uniref:Substance-P receptor-like n=1 Tax=Saccoglossus kowalevskii TaxID=10224 RepID=A0ABM0MHI2_SACKO|nr:PREDICTED: substance-P receptor-like [Saccoglossus kowalevskii]